MEVRKYFESYYKIEWEYKYKADQTFVVLQTLFKKKYDLYVKHSKKKHGQFEGANVIQKVKYIQEQLDTYLQDYLEQIESTNGERINEMSTAN